MGRTWLQRLETFLIVTVISVLVWLYADVQTVKQWPTQHVQVKLVPQGDGELAIEPSVEQTVQISFRASNQQYQQFVAFNRRLKEAGRTLEVPVDAPPPGSAPTRAMSVADLLERSDLNDLRLEITSTNPVDLPVRVEPLERVQLPVKVRWDGTNVAGEPTTDTKRATATVPRSLADAARKSVLIADLTQASPGNAQPGIAEARQVPLRLPDEVLAAADDFVRLNVSYQPEAASVTFTLQSQHKSYTLKSVKVYKSVLPTIDDRFEIVIPPDQRFVYDVVITGPSKEVEAVEADPSAIGADLRPTMEQLENLQGDTLSLIPRLTGLPPQVYVTSTLPQIQVKVTARSSNGQ